MSESELFYTDELQRLVEDNRIRDLQTRCKYIENLKESGNQSNFSIKECKKL